MAGADCLYAPGIRRSADIAAWTGFLQAAREIAMNGTFTGLARAVPFAELDGSFQAK